jgi:hypothetical protein
MSYLLVGIGQYFVKDGVGNPVGFGECSCNVAIPKVGIDAQEDTVSPDLPTLWYVT